MMIYLIIPLIGFLIVHWKIRYSDSGKLIDQIPGPTPLPLLGNILMFNVSPEKLWLKILEIIDQYYPILRLWFINSATVIVCHPDDLKILLSCKKNINKAKLAYDNFRFVGNEGLIVSGGEKWRRRRKMMAPAFNPMLLKAYTELAEEQLQRFIKNLKSQGDEITVDLLSTFTKLNLSIVAETAMGVDLNNFSVEIEEAYRHAFHELCELTFYRAFRPYIRDWMMRFLSVGRRQAKAVKKIRDFVCKVVEERRNHHKKHDFEMLRRLNNNVDGLAVGEDATPGPTRLRLSVLDLLLAAQLDGLIGERGIREEVSTIFAAGHDTVSVCMAFSLMLFAENQDAQELVRAEVLGVAERNDGRLIDSEIQKLDYLERCVKESLRLFPPAPVIGRHVTHDLHLGKYTLPAGHDALVNFYALHRNPHFWPDPSKFDPDRFLPENSADRHPFAYLPFSAGPRVCNGQKLAMMELKMMLAHVLANFRIEALASTADLQFEMHFTMRPTRPICAKFVRID